jgi:hypothetical protein
MNHQKRLMRSMSKRSVEDLMSMADRDIRMQIMLQPQELGALDDWRFLKRMPSRAAAVRELLRRGLASEGFNLAEIGKHSSAFGVTDGAEANTRRRRRDGR